MIDVNSLWNHYRNLLIFTAVTLAIIQPENIQLFQFKSFKTAFYLGPLYTPFRVDIALYHTSISATIV